MSPYLPFIDSQTGNTVKAIQAGHPGSLVVKSGFEKFEEGDYLVTFPVDFQGEQDRQVFPIADFKKRFKTTGSEKTTWENWLDQVGFVPKKKPKSVR